MPGRRIGVHSTFVRAVAGRIYVPKEKRLLAKALSWNSWMGLVPYVRNIWTLDLKTKLVEFVTRG